MSSLERETDLDRTLVRSWSTMTVPAHLRVSRRGTTQSEGFLFKQKEIFLRLNYAVVCVWHGTGMSRSYFIE